MNMVSAESVKNFYNCFDFDKMIDSNAPKLIQDFLVGEINFIKKHIIPNTKILEIGCGYGRLLEFFSKKEGVEVVGIDFSKKMVNEAKKNLSGFRNVSILQMDATNLSFEDNTFDYVVCLDNSFGNMPNIESNVIREMSRVCKLGGKLIVSVFSENALDVQRENYSRLELNEIKDNFFAITTLEGFYSRRFTKDDLRYFFNEVKLNPTIIKLCPVNYLAYATKF